MSFELSQGALLPRISVLDAEHAVVCKDSRNTDAISNQKRQYQQTRQAKAAEASDYGHDAHRPRPRL